VSRVEVLAPLRIETRFIADAAAGWTLKLRVYPDDFSLGRVPAPPIDKELEVLEEVVNTIPPGMPEAMEIAAFRSAAAALGARRAWWLWRTATATADEGAGPVRRVTATASAPELSIGVPYGLPDALDVWIVFANNARRRVATLQPQAAEIAKDLQHDELMPQPSNTLPRLWWLDYERAIQVGLAADIALTSAEAFAIATLVVVGSGSTPVAELITAHAASGRLAPIAQGTPTNTVAGEPTAALGEDPETWVDLLATNAADQASTASLLNAFGVPPAEWDNLLPLPNGDLHHLQLGKAAVRGLWPLLWGRALRDVVGSMGHEPELAEWAAAHLAVQGPLPAIRVGDQPYGVLPTSLFAAWRDDPDDASDLCALEQSILEWTRPWRTGAAAAVAARSNVLGSSPAVGASSDQLLWLQGRHAPSAYWRVRPVLDLAVLQAIEIQHGYSLSVATEYDLATAKAWRGIPYPWAQVAPAGPRCHVPGPPHDGEVLIDVDPPNQVMRPDFQRVLAMIREHPGTLYRNGERVLGLLGHLIRETMIAARAVVASAWRDASTATPPDPALIDRARRIPMDENFNTLVLEGTDAVVNDLGQLGGLGKSVATWFGSVQAACEFLVKRCESDTDGAMRAVKATLDTASFRVDPWLMGVAHRRLLRLAHDNVPFLLGAYGWVDAPRPWRDGDPDVLRPGPTTAGLLHAPSHAQAQVAAVLRDAAVNNPADQRWDLDLDSEKVRRSIAFGERVRLGVHPFEALGLEVEAVVGDPNFIRLLRTRYPTVASEPLAPGELNDPTRRVCDGMQVLDAARAGTLPAGLPAQLAMELEPLRALLDTYADLLLIEGVHALVTRSPEAGGAAMEAAAGLSTPPELRGIRTPREATTIEISCWALLPAEDPDPDAELDPDLHPVLAADPAFAALVGADALIERDNPAAARGTELLGGSEAAGMPLTRHAELVKRMIANLKTRRTTVKQLALSALDLLPAGVDEETLKRLDLQWGLQLHPLAPDWTTEDRRDQGISQLQERIKAGTSDDVPATVTALQANIRSLVARPDLPVLAIVKSNGLPTGWNAPVGNGALDRDWLEIVAAVHPRLAVLEAHQLTAAQPWPASLIAADGKAWSTRNPVDVFYGPGVTSGASSIAVALLDSWVDSVPSRKHTTQAAFGFNAPKARAPQAVLLAVPPDVDVPLADAALLDTVLEVRETALARAARPTDRAGLPWTTPAPIVQLRQPVHFLDGWPA